MEKDIIEVKVSEHQGNLVRYDYNNDGSRDKLRVPYREQWKSAKFRLPSGKPKNEVFDMSMTDDLILEFIEKKYRNLKFKLSDNSLPSSKIK
jgi:hypothetical protein